MKLLIVPTFLLLIGLIAPQTAVAETASNISTNLQPFRQSDIKADLCQDAYGTNWNGHTGLPPLFKNVSKIYLSATSGRFYRPDEKGTSIFDAGNLALLSACTIDKVTKSHIPVYLSQGTQPFGWDSFLDRSGVKEKGSLLIRVSAVRQSGMSFHSGINPGDIVIVKAAFYRADSYDLNDRDEDCSSAFTFTNDQEKVKALLSDALHLCLDKPFYHAAQ